MNVARSATAPAFRQRVGVTVNPPASGLIARREHVMCGFATAVAGAPSR